MNIHLLRHATIILQYGGYRLLVDPVLCAKGALPPIFNSPNSRPNPLVELPVGPAELNELLAGLDGVLVTHTHQDHFDEVAAELIPKGITLFCQPQDEQKIKELGFKDVRPVEDNLIWNGITITRTGGRHGSETMGPNLGPVSGFVLSIQGEPKIYIAGDTVWCPAVEQALIDHQPEVVLVNAGAAQFLEGGCITMSTEDIALIAEKLPDARIVAVHMEAYNHCLLSRNDLRVFIGQKGLNSRVLIPVDGEKLNLDKN